MQGVLDGRLRVNPNACGDDMEHLYNALDPLQNNIYADQLRRGFRTLRFDESLEQEYLNYLHKVQARYQRMGSLLALAIWLTFTVIDELRLSIWERFPAYEPELWALLAIRVSIALILALLVAELFRPRRERYSAVVVATMLLSMVLSTNLAVLLYDRMGTAISNSVLLVMAIALFFPLGLSLRTSLLIAVLSVPLVLFPGILLLEDIDAHLRLSLMYVLALIVCALGGCIRDHAQREQFLLLRLLQWQSGHDALTGLNNRRSFTKHMELTRLQSRREQRSLGLLMLDIDHFKAYNDHYGHQSGDETLRQVGGLLQRFVRRPMDMAVRLGGEEFAMLLYDLERDQLAKIGEQVRREVCELRIPHLASTTAEHLTISIGGRLAYPNESSEALYRSVDSLLYEAKRSGRNRLVIN